MLRIYFKRLIFLSIVLAGSLLTSGCAVYRWVFPAPREALAETGMTLADRELLDILVKQEDVFRDLAEHPEGYSKADQFRRIQDLVIDYNTFLIDNPDHLYALILYGKLLRTIGKDEAAYRVFLRADAVDPEIAVVHQQMGHYLSEKGKFAEALERFKKATELSPETALYHYQFARFLHGYRDVLIEKGLRDRAALEDQMLQAFKQAAYLEPENRDFQFRYAETFYDLEEPDWSRALQLWEALRNTSQNEREAAAITLHCAKARLAMGRYAEARRLAESVEDPALESSRRALLSEVEALSHPSQ